MIDYFECFKIHYNKIFWQNNRVLGHKTTCKNRLQLINLLKRLDENFAQLHYKISENTRII